MKRSVVITMSLAVLLVLASGYAQAQTLVSGSRLAVFGNNFEVSLRSLFGQEYVEFERQACDIYGLSTNRAKPLVARYVADNIPYQVTNPGWLALSELKEKIAAM